MGFGLLSVSDVCVCWCGAMRSGLYDVKRMIVLIFGKVGFVLFADWFMGWCG